MLYCIRQHMPFHVHFSLIVRQGLWGMGAHQASQGRGSPSVPRITSPNHGLVPHQRPMGSLWQVCIMTSSCTVKDVRSSLTADQNERYRDYQVERWIHNSVSWRSDANKAVVIKAINSQLQNEQRAAALLRNPTLLQKVVVELNKGV